MRIFSVIALLCLVCVPMHSQANPLQALSHFPQPQRNYRHPEFEVPAKLRPRVNFWFDVFTKYGKDQSVIHHRAFPQVVFDVLDFSSEAQTMNPAQLERYRQAKEKEAIRRVSDAVHRLSQGMNAESPWEIQIEQAMAYLPPGLKKYRDILEQDYIRTQTGIREKFIEALKRSGRYMQIMEKIFVQDYGLPKEITRLPFIESSFDYNAKSSVGALGIWQFMKSTGKIYMTVNNLVDERKDVIQSTKAAARYLRSAYGTLGSWPLAITSYNHGVGGVAKKVRMLGTSNIAQIVEHPTERPFGFASTNFYPEFLAALEVYENYRVIFPGLELDPPVHVSQVPLPRPISAGSVSRQFGVGIDQLRALNLALSDSIWSGRYNIPAGYILKVPHGQGDLPLRIVEDPEPEPIQVAPPASAVEGGLVYRVRKGDNLLSIAKRYKVPVFRLREANKLKSDALKIGQVLIIKQEEGVREISETPRVVTPAQKKISELDPAKTYRVASGDSLWTISKKFGLSLKKLQALNNLSGQKSSLKPGQIIKIRE